MNERPELPHRAKRIESSERPALDPDAETMRRLGYAVIDELVEQLTTLSDRPVVRPGSAAELSPHIDEPLPLEGRGAESSLAHLLDTTVPWMTRVNHPRFHAYIPVPGTFYGVLGDALTSGLNLFTGSWLGGGAFNIIELVALRWIAEAIGYPGDAAGIFTSGGSTANLTAIAAARARLPIEERADAVLYVSEQGHTSFDKAALLLGFLPTQLRRLPTDRHYRLELGALERAIAEDARAGRRPLLVSANAGTTNTGAIDPLPRVAELCAENDLWFHVDAAYGGFAALCDEGREKLAGMERADSLTLDPHKWLYVPMGVGCSLVRHRQWLETAFRLDGDYLRDIPRHEVNFFERGPELSRRGRALSVWMTLRSLGIRALAEQVEWDLRLAQLVERLLGEDDRFEIVTPAQLSVVVFRHRAESVGGFEEATRRDNLLMERVLEDGRLMLSSTDLDDRLALRFVVMNHRTTESEVHRSVEILRLIADHL